ncbi:ParB N-terminal domain-containing protein [Planctomicrobium sp. SH664]|uniref:ParB N-terminal domain-containing protein n=1 Tax=Planctomicrobium sp. SH664 TaxID=3448125 RepID=UPI003F5CAC72
MQWQRLDCTELKPAPYNPRLKLKPGDAAWKKLERSLDEFDLVQPIVWNRRTGHVVAGHQRLAVLKSRGVTEVDCVIVDLPLEKEKALNVTLNNSAVASDWDAGLLIELINDLQSLPDFDTTLTGFDDQQLKDMLLAPAWEAPSGRENDCEGDPDVMQVTLECPVDDWPDVQQHLDELLAEFPQVRLHLRRAASG